MKSPPLQIALPTGLVLAVAVLSGCQSSGLSKFTNALPTSVASLFGVNEDVRWANQSNPAVRCVCLWQPADGTWEGRPCRGFGGQVFFLDRQTARPVAVKGDVRIHVWDDFGPRENHGEAVHTFDFTKGAWNAFLVKTQFGPSYNIFIPYTRKGHQEAGCALRVRLVEQDTPTIFSDMSYVKLDGASKDKNNSTESLAATVVKRRADQIKSIDPIGQISKTNGVTHASVKQTPPRPKLPRSLSPQLEARLDALQKTMPVKPYDASQLKPSDAASRFGSPDTDTTPTVRHVETNDPRRFTTPASASPILQNTHPLSDPKTPGAVDSSLGIQKRHTLPPAHPLDGPSASTSPIQPARGTAADRSAWHNGEPITEQATHSWDRMIREAEAAAADRNWSLAIRLASKVDRAVRSGYFSWPLDRLTPSALVAQWEVQRIDMATPGDPAQRTARIDSRVDDYLKASRAQLEKDQASEARRLATVAHLLSRAATRSRGVNVTEAGHHQSVVTPTSGIENSGGVTTKRPSSSGWEESPKPAKPTRSVHPLETVGADK